ncbi:Cobalt-precorrin-8X methylmutase [Pluralibacter gergoviae]|nr:Cobalt-precorrin-8X methylmutase [Pluralibacter gergoviae]
MMPWRASAQPSAVPALFTPIPPWRFRASTKRCWRAFGGECRCYISDPRVVAQAKAQGITRSMAAVDIAVAESGEKVFVFGNAPTALFRLLEHDAAVSGAIGVPVGFVGAAESKQALTQSALPAIAALGRKGGSNVAAAIVNAILYHLRDVR